jgi:long-chain acyl-CoA synthetase
MMEKIWLKSYPAGVATEVNVDEYRSLGELFDRSVDRFGERAAFVNMGQAITYRELDRLSRNFGAYLQGALKLQPSARVAFLMPNILQYPIALFGVLRAGYTVVACNPLYTPRELARQLKDSGAEAIVILENRAWVLAKVIAGTEIKHVIATQIGDMLGFPRNVIVNVVVKFVKRIVPAWRIPGVVSFRSALKQGEALAWKPTKLGHDDIAFLQYTGGITGVPKGAMLTHGNILANLEQAHAWMRPFFREGDEIVITALPLDHIFAMTANCLIFVKLGGTNVLITDPRDIAGFVKELAKYPYTAITGVNTLFNALLRHPDFSKLDFSHLRNCLSGGMALHREVAEKWKKITGTTLIEAYGLTEASPGVTMNPFNLRQFNGSVGLPLPSTEVAIRDDQGRDLPIGQAGELCVRGPQVMKGYWKRPDETAKAIMPDGFLRTGDIAVMDEKGFFRIVDRKKDTIVVSGFKVYPNEVEEVVAMHRGVLDVGAVGVPDANSGEAVKIFVVKKDANLTAADLVAHCRKSLAAYKVPRRIEFRNDLPKSAIGKVLRRVLREGEP